MSIVTTSRILVIDDDLATCRFMQELLATPDREIETINDPEQALARVRDRSYDLVISDLKLNAKLDGCVQTLQIAWAASILKQL